MALEEHNAGFPVDCSRRRKKQTTTNVRQMLPTALLCEVTKIRAINTGSVEEQRLGKDAMRWISRRRVGGERSGSGGKPRLGAIKVWEGIRLRCPSWGDGWYLPRVGCRETRVGHQERMGGVGKAVSRYYDVGWGWQYRKQR